MSRLAELTHDDFDTLKGEVFELHHGAGTIPLTLETVEPLGHPHPGATRAPFSLSFRGAPGLRLPQGIHRLEHRGPGTMEIFLTQLAADPAGSLFEAVFS